jgi:hypothetical protein
VLSGSHFQDCNVIHGKVCALLASISHFSTLWKEQKGPKRLVNVISQFIHERSLLSPATRSRLYPQL